jgi:hypothetical protein
VCKAIIHFINKIMSRYERDLLNELNDTKDLKTEGNPLQNIFDAMGSVRQIVGNPLFKAEITLHVSLRYWDFIAMVPIAPAALPAYLQNFMPVYLFGLTDLHGGYLRSTTLNPLGANWAWNAVANDPNVGIFNYTYNPGVMMAVWMNPPLIDGDLVYSVLDVTGGTNSLCRVVVHCNNIAYGTFLNSLSSDLIVVKQMRLFVPVANANQFQNPLTFGYQTLFGKLKTDSVDPYMYQLPTDFQNQIADIPISYPVDKNLILTYRQNFDCLDMDIVLYVEKVQPLTLRPRYK